ncbi:hypothetical protein [Bifidobacterium leontopitheci]|uniref:Uncharacterized protein n=1 Tax=Bifidobacterium leontopitheci TaxID=2650774 RepID=A0A6I1GW38_9BIFI|nr:hypothetical protein [Bifidobacterium leontopitheci]KAB7790671.1 hypothetical protein F7D09_0777 [Bifidobacterium leontopitheci]
MLGIVMTIGLIIVTALCAIFGVQHHLDDKANRLSHGNTVDRAYSKDLRDISRKMDHGKYYPYC